MKRLQKITTLAAVFVICAALLAGCGKQNNDDQPKNDTLVVGTLNFDGKFSPFFYTNTYEGELLELVHRPGGRCCAARRYRRDPPL